MNRLKYWLLGALGLAVFLYCGSCGFGIWANARQAARISFTDSQLKKASTSLQLYLGDNNDRYPLARNWETASARYSTDPNRTSLGDLFPPGTRIAMNRNLSGFSSERIESISRTVELFAMKAAGPNASGGKEDVLFTRGGFAWFSTTNCESHGAGPKYFREFKWNPL